MTAKKILFISNGNGEDSMAAAIVKQLPKDILVDAYPIIGFGNAYNNICSIVGPRLHIPSQGHRKAGSIAKDVKGGMISGTWKTIKFLRSIKNQYHKIVVVGDSVVPFLSVLAGLKIDIYLDVYKNGYAHKYLKIEKWAIKKSSNKVYCRDDILASSLRKIGVDAISKGNIMLDLVPFGEYNVEQYQDREFTLSLFPGSRKTTAINLRFQIDALKRLPNELIPDIFVAVARDISVDELTNVTQMKYFEATTNNPSDLGFLSDGKLKLHLTSEVAGNIIEGSHLLLSQAATLTLQALGMGKPVISFIEENDRQKRTDDRKKLAGESRIFVSQNIEEMAKAIERLLLDKTERDRMGMIGQTRIGTTGTLEAVLMDINN